MEKLLTCIFSHHEYEDDERHVSWKQFRRMMAQIDELNERVERLMANEADLETAQAREADAVAQLAADEAQTAKDVAAEIKALQDQVAAGTAVTAAQLQSAVDKANKVADAVTAQSANLRSLDPGAPAPSPVPVPPAPVDPPAPAPVPVDPTPPAPAPVAATPVYTHDGDLATPDPAWPDSGQRAADGRTLYTYSGDTPGQPPMGDGSGGVWHLYTGPTA